MVICHSCLELPDGMFLSGLLMFPSSNSWTIFEQERLGDYQDFFQDLTFKLESEATIDTTLW
jgi:hypothetical protein